MTPELQTYWEWLFRGSGDGPGYRRVVDRWLFLHLAAGATVAWLSPMSLEGAASTVLLPVSGIFVGLAFAWSGNAYALLQSPEIRRLSQKAPGGFVDYVFTFQTATLVILGTLLAWGIAGVQVFDYVWPTRSRGTTYGVVKALLFGLASLTIRECWHVVLGTQFFLLIKTAVSDASRNRGGSDTARCCPGVTPEHGPPPDDGES